VLFLTSVPLLLFPFFPSFVFLSSSFPFVISLCFLSIWECQHSGTVFLLLPVVTETQHVINAPYWLLTSACCWELMTSVGILS
jgi:hypothetical protein